MIIDLKKFYNRNVYIVTVNGKRFTGRVIDYIYPEDNENQMESIIVEDTLSGKLVEFYGEDIESIS